VRDTEKGSSPRAAGGPAWAGRFGVWGRGLPASTRPRGRGRRFGGGPHPVAAGEPPCQHFRVGEEGELLAAGLGEEPGAKRRVQFVKSAAVAQEVTEKDEVKGTMGYQVLAGEDIALPLDALPFALSALLFERLSFLWGQGFKEFATFPLHFPQFLLRLPQLLQVFLRYPYPDRSTEALRALLFREACVPLAHAFKSAVGFTLGLVIV